MNALDLFLCCSAHNILLITHNALNRLAPTYISDMLVLLDIYVTRRNLRSSSGKKLVVPTYNLCSYGYRSFSISARTLWTDSLPQNVRLCETLDI